MTTLQVRGRRVWPVIHVKDESLALANARIAADSGAYGVFLIQMEGQDHLLDPIARAIRQAAPWLALGVNYLSMDADFAASRALYQGYHACWSDRPGVRSDGTNQTADHTRRLLEGEALEFFASVAFKYQPHDPDPGRAATKAAALGMLPTTSGPATGIAPDLDKLAIMREALGSEARLAVASGVTPENAASLKPFVTDFLVATGIGQDFYRFDPAKLAQLMAAVR